MNSEHVRSIFYRSGSCSDRHTEEDSSSSEVSFKVNNNHSGKNGLFFVCTSNTCRSPMAEGVAKALVKKKNLPIEIGSFGVWAHENSPASQQGVEICASEGIDISKTTSTEMKHVDFEQFENLLVVCMSNWHQRGVRQYAEKHNVSNLPAENVILLDPNGENVYDPVGSPKARYKQVYDFMKPHIEQKVLDFGEAVSNNNNNEDFENVIPSTIEEVN